MKSNIRKVKQKRTAHLTLPSRPPRRCDGHWQDVWNECENNKLHAIHPILSEWSQANGEQRREEVVLARVRIGHTYLTHSFLLKSEDVP